jgi:hypothetical protein
MSRPITKTAALLRMAKKGPIRARDLEGAGIPRAYLSRLTERGLLGQVDRDDGGAARCLDHDRPARTDAETGLPKV